MLNNPTPPPGERIAKALERVERQGADHQDVRRLMAALRKADEALADIERQGQFGVSGETDSRERIVSQLVHHFYAEFARSARTAMAKELEAITDDR